MNKIILTIVLTLSVFSLRAQTVDTFMEDVNMHHPGINAARKLLSAGEAESLTGLTPEDPKVSLGYFPGNEPTPGDKMTWGISQSFDFPTRYARIKALKKSNLELARMEYALTCVQILSEARAAAIEYLSLCETGKIFNDRLNTMNKLETAYSDLLNRGETTLIEYNKIRINQVEMISELASLNNTINLLKTRLDFMSGNNSNDLTDVSYPEFEGKDFEPLMEQIKLLHPAFLVHALRTNVADNAIRVSVSESMPSFELGYSSEIVADQRFTGPSLGISIPLWKNRGNVLKSKAESDYEFKKAEREILQLESLFSGYFASYISNVESIAIIKDALDRANNKLLLDNALNAGEMDLTEYLLELASVYELEDLLNKLSTEKYLLLSKLNEIDFCID